MARHSDPERIYQAHREGTRQRLIRAQGELPDRAEALVAAWRPRGTQKAVLATTGTMLGRGWPRGGLEPCRSRTSPLRAFTGGAMSGNEKPGWGYGFPGGSMGGPAGGLAGGPGGSKGGPAGGSTRGGFAGGTVAGLDAFAWAAAAFA
jgi:hypothetical protein